MNPLLHFSISSEMPALQLAWSLPQGSTLAPQIDLLTAVLTLICGGITFAVALVILFFCIRYRAGSPADRTNPPEGSMRLEMTWIFVPLAILLVVFGWGSWVYLHEYRPPGHADVTIDVVAKQWMWEARHAGGEREINELHVPANRIVELNMISQDVIHSFFVPAFRLKRDLLPGRYEPLWFNVTKPGTYPLLCAEYCGTDHSRMRGVVIAMEPARYQEWLASRQGLPEQFASSAGAQLYRGLGCSGCHSPAAHAKAPDLAGIFGRTVVMGDGSRVVADRQYVRDSILLPNKQIVAGYDPIMPSYQGALNESQLLELIDYLQTLDRDKDASQ